MSILHVITSLHTGGAETLVVNLIPHFIDLGYEVGVVVFNGEETPLMKKLLHDCPDCKLYKLGHSYYNPFYIIKLIWIMRKYDIIHTHNSSPQLFVAIANIFYRKKIVTTEHNTNNRKRNYWLLSMIDNWMYPRYDKIICISDQAKVNLLNYLKTTSLNSICTIYNGIDVKAFRNAHPIKEEKKEKFIVVMVAGFRPQKDQDTLIKAFSKLPPDKYKLWLIGDGERHEILYSLVRNLKLQQNVIFGGTCNNVPNILQTADIVVLSSHYEGLSLSNIEGMATGKPFVASDVEGIHEVTNGYGILFPHEDEDALAAIIKKLHDDKEYYQKVACKCFERAQEFDISKTVKAYSEVYKQLAN